MVWIMYKNLIRGLGICMAVVLAGAMVWGTGIQVSAQSNFNSYTYDEWDDSVAAPASYQPVFSRNGIEIGAGAFNTPQDLFMDADGHLYVVDTGNNRIVVLDAELNLQEIMESVRMNGEEIPLTDIEGLYVTEEHVMYASQTSASRVLVIEDGEVTATIEKPVSSLIAEDFIFAPTKIGIDIYGRAYVLSKGCYSGLLQFDVDGSFMGFFGANKVEVTADVIFNYMWKNLLSDAQRAAMTSILPIEYSNVDCSRDGFVYTSTVGTQLPKSQIKKLNPLGNNIYYALGNAEFNFGDEEFSYTKGKVNYPSFMDVKVDEDGFIFAIDLTSGRIFERDQEANLIGVFGGMGNQLGTFQTPVAVEVYQGRVYVLDRGKSNITVFEPTEYGALVEEATILYNNGLYDESSAAWQQVLARNANSTLAYNGIGKAYAQAEEYTDALKYLRYSGDKYSYSRSFSKNRLLVIRKYGPFAVIGLVLIVIGVKVAKRAKRRKKDER
ncbi:MAG: hypothetical protein HDR26_07960 [Lachnospiraceae bacterium]|nr:hypothetical protein [Lachnospiraceae bacterium]